MLKYLIPACILSVSPTWANTPPEIDAQHFVVISGGAAVGSLNVTPSANELTIDYVVVNNGRGPRQSEKLTLDGHGAPLTWDIKGTSLGGGVVQEAYKRSGTTARWESQADNGRVKGAKASALYIGNDASPWALGLYVRQALAHGGVLNVLPGGQLEAKRLRDLSFGSGETAIRTTAYQLKGLDLEPEFVVLDETGSLFAVLGAQLVVRKGYEDEAPRLASLYAELTTDLVSELQRKLAHHFTVPVRVANARIFDVASGALLPGLKSALFYGDRITAIDDQPDPRRDGEVRIDAKGGTLVPGLTDMHSHSSYWSGLYYLAAGVTLTRDMGNDNAFLDDLIQQTESQAIAGPKIVRSGFLEGKSPFSAHDGFIVDSVDAGLERVRWYADHGYWQFKLYNSINPQWTPRLAAEAHRLGMKVVGHTPAFATPDEMVIAGFDELTHINQLALGWLYLPGEDNRTTLRITALYRIAALDLGSAPVTNTIALMKQHGTGLDTTMVLQERLSTSRSGQTAEGDAAYLDHMPISYQRYRKRTFVPIADSERDAAYFAARDKMLDLMRLLHEKGVMLWPGTDDGTGVTLHRELELYVKAGFTAGEAIRRDTLEAATHVGLGDQLGSLARGKLASFNLYAGDPTQDINELRRPMMVVRQGQVYFPEEIYSALGVKPFAPRPQLTEGAH